MNAINAIVIQYSVVVINFLSLTGMAGNFLFD